MIDPNKVTEAISEFMKNPGWNDTFINAPAGAMERLAISFYFSKFHDSFAPEDFEEYRNLREEIEKSLGEEDLSYLIESTDKPDAKQHYQQLLEQLRASGGTPNGAITFEETKEESKEVPAQEEGESKEGGEETNAPTEPQPTEELPKETAEPTPKEDEEASPKEEVEETIVEGEEKEEDAYDTALGVALNYLKNEEEQIAPRNKFDKGFAVKKENESNGE